MRTAVKAAVRIIIIYIFIQLIVTLVNQIGNQVAISRYSDDYPLLLSLTLIVGGSLLGTLILYLLWIKTDWLVQTIAGEIPENKFTISTSNLDLVKVAMRILGIILLVYSIPTLIGLLGYNFSFPEELMEIAPDKQATLIRELIIAGVKIIFGVWLVLGSRGIDKIWDKAHLINKDQEKE